MPKKRTDRLNSLLREVIADVIKKEVHDPRVHELVTITRVDITKDLHHAKVYFSVIGDEKAKKETLEALTTASGFIAAMASKQVVLRFFPELLFRLDEGVENYLHIDELLQEIKREKKREERE